MMTPNDTDQLGLTWVADVFGVTEELADFADDRMVAGTCQDATILFMEDPEDLVLC